MSMVEVFSMVLEVRFLVVEKDNKIRDFVYGVGNGFLL